MTSQSLRVGGLVIGGAVAVALIVAATLLVGTLCWGVVVFYGSMLVHWAFNGVPSATFKQAVGIGFILTLISAVFARRS